MDRLAVSVAEAAQMLGVSKRTGYRLVASGILHPLPGLAITRIAVAEIERLAASGQQGSAA